MGLLASRLLKGFALATFAILVFAANLCAQTSDSPNTDIGLPANGNFTGSNFDSIQLENGNLHFEIPLWSVPGRGKLHVVAKLIYDSQGFSLFKVPVPCPPNQTCPPSYAVHGYQAFKLVVGPTSISSRYTNVTPEPLCNGTPYPSTVSYVVEETNRTSHTMAPANLGIICNNTALQGYAADGSGWVMNIHSSSGPSDPNGGLITSVYDTDGTSYPSSIQSAYVDSNGNEIPLSVPSTTDTLGRPFTDSFTGNSSSPTNVLYVDSSGATQTIQITWNPAGTAKTSLCQFAPKVTGSTCSETTGPAGPQTIILPDGRTYSFTYTAGPYGTPASVILPDGGQVSWTYGPPISVNGPLVASRTETSNGVSATWTYSPIVAGTVPSQYLTQMTVLDPLNNKMVFSENLAPVNLTSTGSNIKQFYNSSGSLLQTVQTDFQSVVTPLETAPNSSNAIRVTNGYLPVRVTTTFNDSN